MALSKRVAAGEALSASRRSRGERGIWQRRYWEHTIRNDRDYAIHMDYIHFNPVKHGLVTEVAAWPFLSFHTNQSHWGFVPLRGQARTMRRMIGASVEISSGSESLVECNGHSTLRLLYVKMVT